MSPIDPDRTRATLRHEAPRVAERTLISVPFVGFTTSGPDNG